MGAVDVSPWRDLMGLPFFGAHDVFHVDAPDLERIGNQGAMTAPGHGFRTHQSDLLAICELNQPLQTPFKLLALHIVSKTPEGRVTPPGVD